MLRLSQLLISLLFVGSASAQSWQLVWSDEFEVDGKPDTARWDYDIGGHGWGNQEWQYYTDRLDNARVEEGVLVIEARQEGFEGNAYTSARLVTRGRAAWQYGRIEARLKLPFGQGLWPAFWMLPTDSPYGGWPTGGEIDIMEYLGHETSRVHGTIHYGGGELGHRFTGAHFDLAAGSFDEDFHTFAIEWEPRRMQWYVDGELYQTQVSWTSAGGPYPAPFDSPFHLLLNVAVGGEWPGYPNESTTFPQRMEVDYVRVYQDADAYPFVALDTPVGGSQFEPGSTVSFAATAADSGSITRVDFLQGGGLLGSVTEPPYQLDVGSVAPGCYAVTALAVDDVGYESESEPSEITVGSGCPDGFRWPFLMAPASIPGRVEAEFYDLGGPGVAYSDVSNFNEGSGIRQDEAVDINRSRDNGGGYDLSHIIAREWVTYTVNVETGGLFRVVARAASGTGGTMRLSIDGQDVFGDAAIDPTGGDLIYGSSVLGDVRLDAGLHELRLDMRSAGFSLNRLVFTELSPSASEIESPTDEFQLILAPNPSSGRTHVAYRLRDPGHVELSLVDMLGRPVKVLESSWKAPGRHRSEIDTESPALASGVYLVVLKTGSGIRSEQFVVIR